MSKLITRPMKASFIGHAVFYAVAAGAFAETTNTVTQPARIVVTATRAPTPVRLLANNPSVISSEDIQAGHYSSIPEALHKKAGVFFRNYADNPSLAGVDIRGFGGDAPFGRVLVLLNGRKLNRPDMAVANWAQIPMQAVERIEVIRGPNSVLYGDHALGGVINIITKGATKKPETSIQATAGSDQSFEQNLVTSGNLNGLGYVVTAGHQSGDGYRDRSAYDTSSGSLRLSGNINEQLSAYVEATVVKEQHQFPGALTRAQVQQNRRQAANPNDDANEKYYSLNAGIKALLSDDLIFNLDGGISRKDLQADIASWFSYYNYKINTYTLSPKLTLFSPVAGLDNEWILGVDLRRETLSTQKYSNSARTARSTDTQVTKDTLGGYITDTLNLTDKLLLNGGFRLEQNRLEVDHTGMFVTPYDDKISRTEEAWQTQLTWLPTDTAKLFASVKSTYRYPFIDEQAIYSGWGDAFNKDLKPETGINYETGAEIIPLSNLTLRVTAFMTDMKDEIAWGGTQNENLNKTTHRGIELSASYKNEIFALDAYDTWLQSEFTSGANNGNKIPWVPQNKLDVNLSLFLTDALTASTHLSYVGSMAPLGDNANTSSAKPSAYTLVDLLLEYKLPVKKYKVDIFVGVDNVFGKKYNFLVTDYGFGAGFYPAPERTFKTGLSVKF